MMTSSRAHAAIRGASCRGSEGTSGGAPERQVRLCGLHVLCWYGAQIELENAGNHNHGLRTIAVLEHCKFQCLRAVHEQAAAKASLILDDPVAVAVPADAEQP